MKRYPQLLIFLLTGGLLAVAPVRPALAAPPPLASELTENARGFVPGYLSAEAVLDSAALLPPPPAAGSPAALADEAAHRAARDQSTPERRAQAKTDANLRFPAAAASFASVLGVAITMEQMPHLVTLLRRSLIDAGGTGAEAAKKKYQRVRPFAHYDEPCCTPEEAEALKKNGAYPSGHSAVGWAWALILAELAPEQATALLARGHDFGQSRVICGVHWQSDVEAGRVIGAAVVARLHADPVFLAQLAEAKKELAAARATPR